MNSGAPLLPAALFALATLALLALPFVPAWREWRHPSDAGALPVPDASAQDAYFLPAAFRRDLERSGDPRPAGPAARKRPHRAATGVSDASDGRPIVLATPVYTTRFTSAQRSIYGFFDIVFAGGATLPRVLAEGRLHLGPRSRIQVWAHGDGEVRLREGSIAVRRVSSRAAVHLARYCSFESVHAPLVQFGSAALDRTLAKPPAVGTEPSELSRDELPGGMQRAHRLWRVDGDCALPAGGDFRGSLVVTGLLRIPSGTCLRGDVKAYGGVVVESGARLLGAVVCPQGIHILAGAEVAGPVLSEDHVLLGAGARVGRPDAPTTVNADFIVACEGASVHGSVWARRAGVVRGVPA